ncbi:PREDICTED: kinesin-like protein KIF27 [Priapulus caudatus]|uniref:Kinesin-like protein KIF27 n=1 Tax=Priapulus caudatus TaxID=37621 RepID=A0ABM1E0I9_PRICU|nr:PREDICTED: kinesin-like protein KIF27 [Priapulus caudatus]
MAAEEVPVRVVVRVRPLIAREKLHELSSCVRPILGSKQLVIGKDRSFTFDHVLDEGSSQDEVYEICANPLVESCFEGYNATVFAYGQTSSGKTHTITGADLSAVTQDEQGIISRAVGRIFHMIEVSVRMQRIFAGAL